MPKESSFRICLSVILIGSDFKLSKNYYSEVFLEECKCNIKGRNISKYNSVNLEFFPDDSDKESF